MDKKLTFESFREFMAAVIAAENGGPERDARLKHEAAATGQSESGGGSAGGYLVPVEYARRIWERVISTGRIMGLCDRQPVSKGDSIIIPAVSQSGGAAGGTRFGGARMYWTDEAGTDIPAAVKFDALLFKLHKLLGLFYATDEFVEDVTAISVAIQRLFALEASFAIERAIVSGDGIAKPLGVLKSACLITVTPEGGQATGSVIYPNLTKMMQRLWGPSHKNAMWLMNAEIFGALTTLESDTGHELFTTDGDGVRRMLSFPYEVCEYTSKTGDAGDLLLGDFTQYILAEKEDEGNLLSSIHFKYTADETAFKLRYRLDGQPGWNAPIVPLNVTDQTLTQSPFVALGARP